MLGFYAAASIVLGGGLLFARAPVRLRPTLRVQWSMLGDILRVGLPGAMITLLTNTTVLLLTGLVGPFGTKAIAGYGMGARLEYIQISIVFGLGTALDFIERLGVTPPAPETLEMGGVIGSAKI